MAHGYKFSFHVAAVTFAISYIYLSTMLVFIDQWFGLWTSPGIINAVVFSGVAVMCVYSYSVAVFTDPGRVPSSFVPDIEDPDNPVHEIKRKGGDLRYCQKCSLYKPPRAHHCRICKRCVLRMVCLLALCYRFWLVSNLFLDNLLKVLLEFKDHHCIWMNNCVGHANYKVFFVFVVYAVIACLYSLILLVGSLTVDARKDVQLGEDPYRTVYVISGLLLIPLNMALGFFLGWHMYLIFGNKTTIEYHEGVRAMWLAEKGGDVYSHPYDLGVYENLISVLGPNILYWVCPTRSHIGSGLRFRTAYDKAMGASTSK